MIKKYLILAILPLILIIFIPFISSADNYTANIYFSVSDTVYTVNERIELKGFLFQTNFTNSTNVSSALSGAIINLSIQASNGTIINNYTLTTDINGTFFSKSNFYSNGTSINASATAGEYRIRAEYKDPLNVTWFSEIEITVVNQTTDKLSVKAAKAEYYAGETVNIESEAIRLIGDNILHISNVTINGTLRNSSKSILSSFTCITGINGKCTSTVIAPSTYGSYILELNNFKAFSSFSVIPFSYNVYMKDELGQSYKNVYAIGEQARVEVQVTNVSDSDVYTFSGYIADADGNVIRLINSTTLNINNSFTNSFLFTVDSIAFNYGAYKASVTVTRTGGNSITSSTLFEVENWVLSVNKKASGSGFEYAYSTFINKTLRFEAYPTHRSNGSVIQNLTSSYFTINLKDNLNNIINNTNVAWNSSCGNEGCYEFSITSPSFVGEYVLETILSYSGSVQTESKKINVIEGIISAESTNQDGALKELFGTNEYVYLSLTSYNSTVSDFNLTDAEVVLVRYMNGTEYNYTNVSNFDSVNSSNTVSEWAWNVTLQRIKLDVPKVGGVYNVFLFGNNRTIGASAKFIVNPYEACSVPKDTPGTVTTGYYYVWQFKTTDTIYFELKLTQANNPLGKATVSNSSNGTSGGSYGLGSACTIDTATKQVVSNATITVIDVKNIESGVIQTLNTSDTNCQATDTSGGYSCTVKPLSKWEGGNNVVQFKVQGQDGTTDIIYSRFEARAFYLYGWPSTWQNSPTSDINLNIRLYEAGSNWWGSMGSGGLSGTLTLKKIEYMGSDGEWLSTPVDSGYNVSNVNSSRINSGAGTISIPSNYSLGGTWKTGYYRAIIQGTTSAGDTDYGYAWFGIKLWDVYGTPIECDATSCRYKNYFNSKKNITIYTKISPAGSYNYNYAGGENLTGNVTISVKKIEDCRKWPCKELNSTQYQANSIIVNQSNPWYWNSNVNSTAYNNYLIKINSTTGTWNTGSYRVVFDVNGTDTGTAWFNTIAFYVSTLPTDSGGINSKYQIKPSETKYFNITTTTDYKGWNANYNETDLINTTITAITLRTWNQTNWESIEYNYPLDLNATPMTINRSGLLNLTFLSSNITANWPSGYYYGELTLNNSDGETSTGWLYFDVKPFRVSTTQNSNYEMDETDCVNLTINVYEPSWYSNALMAGNYTIVSIYENTWTGYSNTKTTYTNYSNTSFNATTDLNICPNNGTSGWGSGSWGGYHYLNIIVQDNSDNSTETGWLSFRSVPFKVAWGSVNSGTQKLKSSSFSVPVNITTFATGANTSANLTRLYQHRYDNSFNGEENYVFSVGSCFSNISGQCNVTGYQNITVYPPSYGWKLGYNYIYAKWTKSDDASSNVDDWSGIYIDASEVYKGNFENRDINDNYKYQYADNENITIKLYLTNSTGSAKNASITNVYYSAPDNSCYEDWCRTYTTASAWSLTNGGTSTTGNGTAIIQIQVPAGGWSTGYYKIKLDVSGDLGTSTITGGEVWVRNMVAPNITLNLPVINTTISGNTFLINFNTSKNTECGFAVYNYDYYYSWGCIGWNTTNSSNSSIDANWVDSCNITKYGFNGTTEYREDVSRNHHSASHTSGTISYYWYSYVYTGLVTGAKNHTFTFNTTSKSLNSFIPAQDYIIRVYCYDTDYNYKTANTVFKFNNTLLSATISSPLNASYNNNNITFNFTINNQGNCSYSLNNGTTNNSMSSTNNRTFTATNTTMADGSYTVNVYCNDTSGNKNHTESKTFLIDTVNPLLSYGDLTPANNSNLTQNFIFVNASVTEINFANITFILANNTNGSIVNTTIYTNPLLTTINWTGLLYGNYTFNISIFDSASNSNSTTKREVNLTQG